MLKLKHQYLILHQICLHNNTSLDDWTPHIKRSNDHLRRNLRDTATPGEKIKFQFGTRSSFHYEAKLPKRFTATQKIIDKKMALLIKHHLCLSGSDTMEPAKKTFYC